MPYTGYPFHLPVIPAQAGTSWCMETSARTWAETPRYTRNARERETPAALRVIRQRIAPAPQPSRRCPGRPADTARVALYLKHLAHNYGKAMVNIRNCLAALAAAHRRGGRPDPTTGPITKARLKLLARYFRKPRNRAGGLARRNTETTLIHLWKWPILHSTMRFISHYSPTTVKTTHNRPLPGRWD